MEQSVVSRRVVLGAVAAVGGGLMLRAVLPSPALAATAARAELTAWVRIGADDQVTLMLSQCEIGQGISTTLPAILADELGADWSRIVIENAPVAPAYQNPGAHWMFTGNSASTQDFAPVMRQAGAAARAMLTEVAATRMRVEAATCVARDGRISHPPSGRSVAFGDVAADAALLPVPKKPTLRAESELRMVGHAVPRRDIPGKTDGSAVFGIDVQVPGMLYATPRQAPRFGGKLVRIDREAALARRGIRAIVDIPNGVAVVADHFWQAKSAAAALDIVFSPRSGALESSESLAQIYAEALDGAVWAPAGGKDDAIHAVSTAEKRFTQDYASPFAAHATMEPMNCTAWFKGDACEVWVPTQGPQLTQMIAAKAAGLPEDRITVHRTLAGGGFGRRLVADFVEQAVLVSKAVGRPVKLIWTREEDMTQDIYRPATLARLTAALDARGRPIAVHAKLVSATQLQFVGKDSIKDGVDPRCTEGLDETIYAIPSWRLDFHMPKLTVPTSVLRTTGFGPNIFAVESFIDELAHHAGADPYAYRRELLAKNPRPRTVLDLAAERIGWKTPPAPGVTRGIAVGRAFDAYLAQAVEVTVKDRSVRVLRVVTAVDPGKVYDRGIAASNIEGGVVWGVSSAFKNAVHFEDGACVERNFDGYDLAHLWESPAQVETILVDGDPEGRIGGLGEGGPVPFPPALAGAIFAATGERLRALPFSTAGYTLAT